MRTSFLQDLYLQRPVTLMILICTISILPWIGIGDATTNEELREITIATSILESGNLVLPGADADDFTYSPPMSHWLIAAFSYPQGYISTFTSRLPSALAFVVLIGFILSFFGKRVEKFQEAFIAACIVATSIGIHRTAMTAGNDMLFTVFIVTGLIQLYRWEEFQELKGLPVMIPILLGCAVLTAGLMGIILPLLIFGIYLLMLKKYRYRNIIKALLYTGISSLFIPVLWYVAAWKQGGEVFLEALLKDLRVFSCSDTGCGIGFALLKTIMGIMPWTVLLFFSLFGIKFNKSGRTLKEVLKEKWDKLLSVDKVRLYSLVITIVFLLFYLVSRKHTFLIPAYTFMAIGLAKYTLYLAEYKPRIIRVFAVFMATLAGLSLVGIVLTMAEVINPVNFISEHSRFAYLLPSVEVISQTLIAHSSLTIVILLISIIALIICIYQIYRKINIKILYAIVGLIFCIHLLIDGVIMKGNRYCDSSQSFIGMTISEEPLNNKSINIL